MIVSGEAPQEASRDDKKTLDLPSGSEELSCPSGSSIYLSSDYVTSSESSKLVESRPADQTEINDGCVDRNQEGDAIFEKNAGKNKVHTAEATTNNRDEVAKAITGVDYFSVSESLRENQSIWRPRSDLSMYPPLISTRN